MNAARTSGVPARFQIASICEVELNQPLTAITAPGDCPVLLVARLCGQPVGMCLRSVHELSTPEDVARIITSELGENMKALAPDHGLPPQVTLTASGLIHERCPLREREAHASRHGEPVSVVLCTRDRAESLRRCIDSVLASSFDQFELIVVDNAPGTDATAQVCAAYAQERADGRLRYVLEAKSGLSRARNTGIAVARHELLAFIDDDERADQNWMSALSAEFAAAPAVGCVSGVVLPAELRTTAQVNFEQFGGHSKGRGFQRVVFDKAYLSHVQSAMYPLPPFGVGANMAFRRAALNRIGGFDVALGAGTPARGGEDTQMFSEVLLSGWHMVYSPAAVTWHYHRSDDAGLTDQLSGYGYGLGAYYTSLLIRDPHRLVPVLRLVPRALRDLSNPDSVRNASLVGLPPGVARGNMTPRVLASGALTYGRTRWRARRVRP